MDVTKRIVCLANSRKPHGRCIAGVELVDGQPTGWVRPVSNREHHEVSEHERQFQDGSDPRVLDIIDIPLLEHRPRTYQQENWLLDPAFYWVKAGEMPWPGLVAFAQPTGRLWLNGTSTRVGTNDKIAEHRADRLRSSLTFIHVPGLQLRVFAPGAAFGDHKRRVQAAFEFNGVPYRFWVTDPVYERRYLSEPDGHHEIGECYLTISLGEPYDGACYKLVAAIIERPATTRGPDR